MSKRTSFGLTRQLKLRTVSGPNNMVSKLATKAYVDRKIKSNTETQYIFDNNGLYATDTANFEQLFDSLARGDNVDNFQGNKIAPTYLQVRGYINSAASDGRTAPSVQMSRVRVILFQWRPDNADDVPVISEILQSPGSSSGDYAFGQYRADQKNKFKVLKDINTYVIASAGNPSCTREFKINIPAKKLLKFNLTTSLLTGENLIYMMVYGSQPNVSAANAPIVRWMAKLSYKDA